MRLRSIEYVAVAVVLSMAMIVTQLGLVQPSPPAAAQQVVPSDCAVDTTDVSIPVGADRRCIANVERTTRGRIEPSCLGGKALLWGAEYTALECRGGRGVQAESIAQARAIARFGQSGEFGTSPIGGIAPGVQWEVGYPAASGRPSGRVDITLVRPGVATDVELIELKQDLYGTGRAAIRARGQLTRYLDELPSTSERPARRHVFDTAYEDLFRIVLQECAGPSTSRRYRDYLVSSVPGFDGVLIVTRTPERTSQCDGQGVPAEDPIERPADIPIEEPVPPVLVPPPGSDDDGDGKDDFWEDFLEGHPELGEQEAPDAPPEPVVTPDILVDVAIIVTIAVVVTAAVLLCAATACVSAIMGAIGGALASGAVGAALRAALVSLFAMFGLSAWGDPHLATLDGLAYGLQSVGEFHLLQAPSFDVDVQSRFVPVGSDMSRLGAVSTVVDGTVIELDGAALRVDGEPTPVDDGGMIELGSGGAVMRTGTGWLVVWPGDGDRPMMSYAGTTVGFHVPDDAPTDGLLGDNDGDPTDDLAYPDGTVLAPPASPATIHGSFADAWRIDGDESLFTYASGQSTSTFTDLGFPANIVTLADLTEAEIGAASEVCVDAGVIPGPQFEACVLDVALTGDEAYADDAAQVTDVLVDGSEHAFDASGELSEDFEGTVGPNFVSSRYSDDPATTRVAGPLFDTPGYRMYARDVPRHSHVELEADLLAYGPIGTDAHEQSVAVQVGGTTVGSVVFDGTEPTLTGGLVGTVERTGVGTTAGGQPFSRFDMSVTLAHSSSALDVTFVPSNFRGVLATALGLDDIAMRLVRPAAQAFTAALPIEVPSAALPNTAGVIETVGGQDEYPFTMAESQPLMLDQHACDATLGLAIVEVATGARTPITAPRCGDVVTDELSASQYRLEVWGETAGTYSLTLAPVPEPQVFDYAIGTAVANGVPATGAGNLEVSVSIDRYDFTVPAGGSSYQFAPNGGDSYHHVTLRNRATGQVLSATGMRSWEGARWDLPAGDYQIEYSGAGPWTYGFTMYEVPEPQVFDYVIGSTVSDGVPAAGAGNLETGASIDRYEFSVPAGGQSLQFAPSSGDSYHYVTMSDRTTGEVLSAPGMRSWEGARWDLPAGDYQIDYSGSGPWTYGFSLYVVPDAQVFDYVIGSTVSDGFPAVGAGNLETGASLDRYNFTVPAGGLDLQFAPNGGDSYHGVLLRNRATGQVLSAPGMRSWEGARWDLPAGDYQIEYSGSGPWTYSFRMYAIPPPQVFEYVIGSTVSDGVPAAGAGNLETGASLDRYHFTVPAGGQSLQFAPSGGDSNHGVVLRNRATGQVLSAPGMRSWEGARWDLPAGDYEIEYSGSGPWTYSFRMYAIPPPQVFEYVIGSTVSDGVPAAGAGNLETGASLDRYHFTVPAGGLSLVFGPHGGDSYHGVVLTNRVTGQILSAPGMRSWEWVQRDLPEGDYQIEYSGSGPWTYSFRLYEVTPP